MKEAEGVIASPESSLHHPVAKHLLHMEAAWFKSLSPDELTKLGAHRLDQLKLQPWDLSYLLGSDALTTKQDTPLTN